MKDFALQLYSIREETETDFAGTLKKVAEMGYTGVEFAGYGEISAKNMKELLIKYNLKAVSSHVDLDLIRNNLDAELEYLKELDCNYIVCPWSYMETIEDTKVIADILNNVAERCAMSGINLVYHNHSHEFDIENNIMLYEHFIDLCDDLIQIQFDVYWVKYAGLDPIEMIRKYAGRVPLLHLKQLGIIDGEKCNVAFSDGIIDFRELINVAKLMGAEHFIVEQETVNNSGKTSMETCRENAEFLKNIK